MGREQQSRQLEAEVTTLRGELAALRGEKRRTVRAAGPQCWHRALAQSDPQNTGAAPTFLRRLFIMPRKIAAAA
jgi:hypothetical protein